jgi:pyrimidine operon attenuation protein/uracil phosphoribosyltransferase
VLQVFRHSDLSHELVLVTVHARKGTNVREDILKGIRELEGVDIAQPVLDMSINDELRQAQNFSTQVESISETRLLPLFRS